MKHENTRDQPPSPGTCAHQGLEFLHLQYLVAVAHAATFTRAAERLFIAQPTLSQQIRRLEELVGTPLLHSRRGRRAAGAEVSWVEAPLDGEFTLIAQHRADAALGWLTPAREVLADPLEVMSLGGVRAGGVGPGRHTAGPAHSDRPRGVHWHGGGPRATPGQPGHL